MNAKVSGVRGEFRRWTPAEIGKFVRQWRAANGVKRSSLAHDATVTEKTLERLESGEKISDQSLRKIASAIDWPADVFVGEKYIPTPDEAIATLTKVAEDFEQRYQEVPVSRLTDPRQFVAQFDSQGVLFQELGVALEHADDAASLKELLCDSNDIASELPATGQLEAARTLMDAVRTVETKGYVVKIGQLATYGHFGPVTILLVVHHSRPDRNADIAYVEGPPPGN